MISTSAMQGVRVAVQPAWSEEQMVARLTVRLLEELGEVNELVTFTADAKNPLARLDTRLRELALLARECHERHELWGEAGLVFTDTTRLRGVICEMQMLLAELDWAVERIEPLRSKDR